MRIRLLLAVLVAAAGCSGPVAGTPSAGPPSGTAAPQTTLGLPQSLLPPKVSLPPRPREIRLDGRDPCAILTESQRRQLGFDRPPVPFKGPFNGDPACSITDSTTDMSTAIAMFTTEGGIELYTRTNQLAVTIAPTSVSGFPALEVRTPVRDAFCDIVIDVAAGQVLDTMVESPTTNDVPQDQLCSRALTVAEAAMISLGA